MGLRRRLARDTSSRRDFDQIAGRCGMAIVLHRRLAIPLWAGAFFVVALTAPPPVAPSVIAVLAIAVIAFTAPSAIRWLVSRSLVHVFPSRHWERSPRIKMAAGSLTADDVRDLVRMD